MIQSLNVQNFQSHKNTNLEFCPGINVITGNSNSGKTAILRALNFVITNKPGGLNFKSSFSDKKENCNVSIVINDQAVIRTKNTSVNKYEIGSSLFDVVGSSVPQEVCQLLNMDEINYSSQFEKHFLITESSGEVGRTINKIVNLDIIDELISNLNSKILSTNREMDFKKSDIDKLIIALKKFENIEDLELLITKVVKLHSDIEEDKTIVYSLKHIIDETKKLENKIFEIEYKFSDLENEIVSLESVYIEYSSNNKVAKDLQYSIDSIKKIDRIISKGGGINSNESEIERFEASYKKYNEKVNDFSKISDIISKWGMTDIKILEQRIIVAEGEFDTIIKQYGCPTCGKGISEN